MAVNLPIITADIARHVQLHGHHLCRERILARADIDAFTPGA
jgi:hypothetical protein